MEHEPDPDDWGRPLMVNTGGHRRDLWRGAGATRTGAGLSGRVSFLRAAMDDGGAANSPITVWHGAGGADTGGSGSEKNHTVLRVPAK